MCTDSRALNKQVIEKTGFRFQKSMKCETKWVKQNTSSKSIWNPVSSSPDKRHERTWNENFKSVMNSLNILSVYLY